MPRSLHEVTIEELRLGNAAVQELIEELLPLGFPREFTWRLWATGLLARSAAIMDSITALAERGRRSDAEVALRTLWEHVTTLCWLAIDPEPHLLEWQEGSESRTLLIDREATEHFGKPMLEPGDAATFSTGELRPLVQRAEAIDRYWPEQIPAFTAHAKGTLEAMKSFRGTYTVFYRTASPLVHAEVDSLQSNVRKRPNQLLVTMKEPPVFGRAGLGLPLFAFGLLVYDHHFGWPGEPRTSRYAALLSYEPAPEETDSTG